jgi:hypothetical protein
MNKARRGSAPTLNVKYLERSRRSVHLPGVRGGEHRGA